MKAAVFILLISLWAVVPCRAWELDRPPHPIDLRLPVYPIEEKQNAREAIVTVLVHVDEKGQAKIVRILTSSSYRFSDATKSAAEHWSFKPAMRDGKLWAMDVEFVLLFDPKENVRIVGPLYD